MGHEGDWKWINSGEPVPDFVWNTGSNSYFEMIYLLSYGIFQESQAVEQQMVVCLHTLAKLMIILVMELHKIIHCVRFLCKLLIKLLTFGFVVDVSSMQGISSSGPSPTFFPPIPDTFIRKLPVTIPPPVLPPSFLLPLAGGLDTDSLEPDLTPAVLWLFSRFLLKYPNLKCKKEYFHFLKNLE